MISTRPPRAFRFDGISCVGSLLLFVLIASIMGTILVGKGSRDSETRPLASGAPQSMATVVGGQLAQAATETATFTPTETPEPSPTNSPTAEPTATATSTPTPSATATMTATPTPIPPTPITSTSSLALPPTETPEDTATPLPTPTETPRPLPTPMGIYSATLKVPILMYHYISIPPEGADEYRIGLSVYPADFRQQMRYLAENGFTPIDLYDLSLAITLKQVLPEKPVIISLDDGYRDNYLNAFPVLKEYGFTATIFLATEFLDQGNEAYLTWEMVREMADYGIRFEPHSKTHPDLRGQDRDFLIFQILGSQETIASHIGYTPRYFAYPSGGYDDGVIQVLQELNFWGAVTTWAGKWHGFEDRFQWTRMRVRDNTPLPEFIDLVDPGDTRNGRPIGGG